MNVFQKARSGTSRFVMRFVGRTLNWSRMLLPGTNRDYGRMVGNGTNSSVAMACLLWIARTFPEARLRVQQQNKDGTLQPQVGHEMLRLIDRPNPYYSGQLLWMATVTDLEADGNAYWVKVRAQARRVVQLWYVPTSLIEPRWPEDGSAYLSEYRYKPDVASDPIILDPNDVVHFRYGIDPANTRKGRAPLATAIREVYTDDEAANFSATVLANLGIPGVILSPDTDVSVSRDVAEANKAAFTNQFGGDNRGSVMVLQGRTKVDVLSWSPQQLNLRDLRRIPEERVSALLGVPAIVAGLGAGLDRSTFSNFSEAREAAYESTIIPLQRLVSAELQTQLLPDFDTSDTLVVDFDLAGIRILQEDENAKTTRLNSQLQSGAITMAEWRSALGYPTDKTHDFYLRPINIVAVPVGADALDAATLTAESRRGALATNVPASDVAASGTPPPDTAPPAKGRLLDSKAAREQRYLQHVERSIHVVSKQAQRDLRQAFAAMADDVVARIEAGKSAELALVTAGSNGRAHDINGISTGYQNINAKLSLPTFMNPGHLVPDGTASGYIVPALKRLATNIGDFVTGAVNNLLGTTVTPPSLRSLAEARATALDMDAQARKAVEAAITDGQAAGDDMTALTQRIHDYVEAGHLYPGLAEEQGLGAAAEYRAETIALTETRTLAAYATIEASREAGVEYVKISDGDGCGWQDHEDGDLADGSIRTLDAYQAYPLAHPRCVRSATPWLEGAP